MKKPEKLWNPRKTIKKFKREFNKTKAESHWFSFFMDEFNMIAVDWVTYK